MHERPWDQALAEATWKGRPRPEGAQSWEGFEPLEGFSRSGGLSRWVERSDVELEAARARTMRLITFLNETAHVRCVLIARGNESEIMRGLAFGLALACMDEARRLSGRPDLVVHNEERDQRWAFASVAHFIAACDTIVPDLGAGSMSFVIAEDRSQDIAARARLRSKNVETMPANQTRSGSRDPRGLSAMDDSLTRGAVLREAKLSVIHPHAFLWLHWFHVGEWRRVTRKAMLGDREASLGQEELVRMTAAEIAAADDEPVAMVRSVLKRARARLYTVLDRRKLVAPPKPAHREPAPKLSPFADW